MNPYRIYRDEWSQALAEQAGAASYSTFVAMPFKDTFSYRAQEVLSGVIQRAAEVANEAKRAKRPFSEPVRVDTPMGASVITEEIVRGILRSHLFLADVTFQNPGVILEVGIALATKPGRQVILITQGSPSELHFDLRGNMVISYSPSGSVDAIAEAFISAANHFEEQLEYYVGKVAGRLSPDAMKALKWYGIVQQKNRANSLHSDDPGSYFAGDDGILRFELATRELRERDLLWTHWIVGAFPGGDAFGMHATELGWVLIGRFWPELSRTAFSKE